MLSTEDHVRSKETESRINCISTIKKAAHEAAFFMPTHLKIQEKIVNLRGLQKQNEYEQIIL